MGAMSLLGVFCTQHAITIGPVSDKSWIKELHIGVLTCMPMKFQLALDLANSSKIMLTDHILKPKPTIKRRELRTCTSQFANLPNHDPRTSPLLPYSIHSMCRHAINIIVKE
jgi:hypothetical protein